MGREVIIMTPEQVEVKFELAGLGSRFLALLIDILWQSLVYLVLFLVLLAFGLTGAMSGLASASYWLIALFVILVFCISSGYFLYFEATKNGQTPGKKAVCIRVVRDTGHPVDFRSVLLRNAMRFVDSLPSLYAIGLISIFFSPQYRRLGDYVAGTLVVKVGRKPEQMPKRATVTQPAVSVPAPPFSSLPPEAIPLISKIEKDEYRTVRHFLDRRLELEETVVRDLALKLASQIAQKLELDTSQVPNPVAFLLAVSAEWERRVIH